MRTVVLPHVNEWKRVPKVARGVVAERGKWERKKEEGARKRETGVVGKRERERGGRTHESKQRGKEARARKRDLCRTNGRRSGKKREREKKKGNERREAHGPCIERSQLLCSQGRSLPLERKGAS